MSGGSSGLGASSSAEVARVVDLRRAADAARSAGGAGGAVLLLGGAACCCCSNTSDVINDMPEPERKNEK